MPGRSVRSALGSSISVSIVRVAVSSAWAKRPTRPSNTRPGNSSKLISAGSPSRTNAASDWGA